MEFGFNIGESDGILQWPAKMGGYLGAILVNPIGYLSGPLKCVRPQVQYW
jgi:hypothetical protein